jgi:hypothetical protein
MQSLLAVAATLACPVGMGLMMWIMLRGHGRTHQTINPGSQQIEEFRAEIGRLKAERTTDTGSGSGPVTEWVRPSTASLHRHSSWRVTM